jgi:hypothetical protein
MHVDPGKIVACVDATDAKHQAQYADGDDEMLHEMTLLRLERPLASSA